MDEDTTAADTNYTDADYTGTTDVDRTARRADDDRGFGAEAVGGGAGALAGGVIGGVIGHQFGSGRGNTAATIGGAVAGAAIGNQIDRNNAHGNAEQSPQPIERCEPVQGSGEDATAYSVVYDFDGQRFTAQLPYDPGPTLEVDEYGAPLER
jgi:uncharacterized protein YcfJ